MDLVQDGPDSRLPSRILILIEWAENQDEHPGSLGYFWRQFDSISGSHVPGGSGCLFVWHLGVTH